MADTKASLRNQPAGGDDERPVIFVHAEVPSSDPVRTFYEIPSVVADHIRAGAPDQPFVEAIVQVFETIDTYRDALHKAKGERDALADDRDSWRRLALDAATGIIERAVGE